VVDGTFLSRLSTVVGYSASLPDGKAVAALQRLAGKTRALTSTEWRHSPADRRPINEPG
jgi:hypothetical protein